MKLLSFLILVWYFHINGMIFVSSSWIFVHFIMCQSHCSEIVYLASTSCIVSFMSIAQNPTKPSPQAAINRPALLQCTRSIPSAELGTWTAQPLSAIFQMLCSFDEDLFCLNESSWSSVYSLLYSPAPSSCVSAFSYQTRTSHHHWPSLTHIRMNINHHTPNIQVSGKTQNSI